MLLPLTEEGSPGGTFRTFLGCPSGLEKRKEDLSFAGGYQEGKQQATAKSLQGWKMQVQTGLGSQTLSSRRSVNSENV